MNTPHFFHATNSEYCDVCGGLDTDPLHLVTDRQVAAEYGRASGEPASEAPALLGRYVHVGMIDLTIFDECSTDALEKLHAFVGNLLAQRL